MNFYTIIAGKLIGSEEIKIFMIQRPNLAKIVVSKFLLGTESEGDIVKKFRAAPKIKPPRRKPSVQNVSNRSDYMEKYMTKYREDGKDYQKVPDKTKKLRSEQRKRLKKKFDLKSK